MEMILEKGTNKDRPSQVDVVAKLDRIDLTVRRLHSPQDRFSISFDQVRGGCVLNLRWEETEASVLLTESEAPPPK